MISDGGSASGKPVKKDQTQEIFKLKMERDAYKAQYGTMVKEKEKLSAANAELQFAKDHKALLLQNAIELIKKFQLELFGKSSEKSRSLDAYCQNLFDEVELLDLVGKQNQENPIQQDDCDSSASENPEAPTKVRKPYKEQDLTTLPANTPVIDVDHTVNCIAPIDPNTGKKMVQIGTKTEKKIGKQHTVVIYNHIFPVFGPEEDYEAEDGESNTVVVYPQTERIIKGSMISNEILAEIITTKYLDHMPLYRQEQYFPRMGIPISRQNMKNWLFDMSEKCGPLVEQLRKSLLSCPLINMDETVHRVLNIEGKASDTENYEIIQVGTCDSWRVAMFSFNVKCNAKVLAALLPNYSGTLMTDGLQSYNVAVADKNNDLNCTKLACWAHARRGFVDLLKANSKSKCKTIVTLISKLYKIESELREFFEKGLITKGEFNELRIAQTGPVFKKIKNWLTDAKARALMGSQLEKATNYCFNRWDQLIAYPCEFHATPDDNLAEQLTRPFSMGASNWLFSNTDGGAKVSSVMYTLAQNAKLNKINEMDYLWALLDRIPSCSTEEDWEKLLPWNIDLSDISEKKALLSSAKPDPLRTEPYVIRGGKY
jgi:hypothetical protein